MTQQHKNRLILVGLFLMFFLPVLLAIVLNSRWVQFSPAQTRNYGQLIQPVISLGAPVAGVSDETLRSRWWLIYADSAECLDACQKQMQTLHQLHLSAGKEFNRVGLMFMPTAEGAIPALPADVVAVQQPSPELLLAVKNAVGAAPTERWLLLMDPLGNILMRYPPGFDASRVRKDLSILLRWSPLGKDA